MSLLLAALLAAAGSPARAQAMADLEVLAAQPGAAPEAYDGGGGSAEAPAVSPAASSSRGSSLRAFRPRQPASGEQGPRDPAEQAAWDRGKAWGGVLGGLGGLFGSGVLAWGLWSLIGAWALVPAGALLAGAVLIGMDVGEHYALDEHRGNLE